MTRALLLKVSQPRERKKACRLKLRSGSEVLVGGSRVSGQALDRACDLCQRPFHQHRGAHDVPEAYPLDRAVVKAAAAERVDVCLLVDLQKLRGMVATSQITLLAIGP